jgi:hypothetical protein
MNARGCKEGARSQARRFLPFLRISGGEQIGQVAFQAATQVLQHIEADILLTHFEAMQGRFGDAEAAGKIPLRGGPTEFPKVSREPLA